MTFTMQDPRVKAFKETILRFDYSLVVVVLGIATMGIVMVYSATKDKLAAAGLSPQYYLQRQAIFVAIGLVVMIVVSLIDYSKLANLSYIAYGGIFLALLGVLTGIGKSALGSQRWYQLGPFQLQPSEFAALGMIMAVAYYYETHQGESSLKSLVTVLVMALIPMGLVIKQPDIGTALIMGIVLAGMLVVAGVPLRYLLLLGIGGTLVIFLVVHFGILKHYQVQRLTAFLNPNKNALTTGYNLTESKIAIGSGSLFGKGLFNGPQTNLAYVPEQQTDFIFTAVGEQLGFIGAGGLLIAYGFLSFRIWSAMKSARDLLGRLLCGGIFALVVYSVFQNAGMTMGIMPITGIPLPFMSYGGSATVAFSICMGFVLNVGMRRSRAERY
ncbi:MAG: rod shape-determining protein RodA [Acidimicrobiaceae bacterium]|nr:rod shape-determining protein RodA [Acidimicrobiaceae bacterium]